MEHPLTCPRCDCDLMHPQRERNALSRKDNDTYVCASCGVYEAMINFRDGLDADVWPGYPRPMAPTR